MSARTPAQASAATPEALHAVIEDAFNRGDIDAFMAVHAQDGTVAVPPDGHIVHGLDEIRAAVAPMFAKQLRMKSVVDRTLEGDGLALTHAHWQLTISDVDGQRTERHGRGTIVSRHEPDGTWKIVLDDPMTPQ